MGLIDNTGGIFEARVEAGWGPNAHNGSVGYGRSLIPSLQNFILSWPLPNAERTFTLRPYSIAIQEVQTIAGIPTAPLDDACGYRDGQPTLETRVGWLITHTVSALSLLVQLCTGIAIVVQFSTPGGLAMYYKANLSNTEYLYIADTQNNVIRAMTATCSKMCENGGVCVADETCQCPTGWTGDDCTTPFCAVNCGM